MSEREEVEGIRAKCAALAYVDGPTYEDMDTLLAHIATLTAENERLRDENDTFSQQNRAWIRENTRLEARVAALEAENERLRVQLEGTKRVRLRTEELVREVDAERARVAALETECAGHKEAFARMLAEAELCGSANDELRERVAALEEALRGAMKKLQRYGEQTEDESAALARPTPTPDQRQYGKKCAHDGYVVAGCRDCEARATTPTPGEGAGR